MDKITEQYLKGFFIFNIQLGRLSYSCAIPQTLARNLEVGANFLAVYDERHNQLVFARTTKSENAKKAQKVWALRIKKVLTNCIIS